ncbi:coiled-coil domain-containing protein 62 isoform X2 [Vombatus ursinus]|uniref:Coiled-coil domain containing 62 n=1 Tax=Vombatus ursinus TaxID=29139 RepID=A0A4X2K2T4_VOMUR|nr:coiled-coil domain-containing protein 62 isoform X2 [Vombatus ursinus]
MNPNPFPRKNIIYSETETHTIEKQRKELQLLIGELRDRDRELSEMVLAHQRQLLAWEDDRQKVLTLEERCCKLENELHKRSEIIRTLTKKIKTLESQQNDHQEVLQTAQQQLQEMSQKATQASFTCEDLEDKDIAEAINHITDCSNKFKMLEHALHDAKMVESCIIKEKQDYKQKMKVLKFEVTKLKDELNEKTTENNEQREEIIHLRQEKSHLHDELVFTVEREKRKEQLLDIAKSKQERTDTELHNLRQVYVKQQSDLQFLHFTAENYRDDSRMDESRMHETSRELSFSDLESNTPKSIIKREGNQKIYAKDHEIEASQVQHWRPEKGGYDGGKEEKRVNLVYGEETGPGTSAIFAKDGLERQRPLPLKEKVQFNTLPLVESKRRSTLGRSSMKSAKSSDSEALSREHHYYHHHHFGGPDHKHCDLNIFVNPGMSRAKQLERLEMEGHEQMEVAETSYSQFNEGSLSDSDICESKCCHPSNFVIEAPGWNSISDVEWMRIFKPSKVERIVRPKTDCTCSRSVCGIKYHPLKSTPIAFWHSHRTGTSNMKYSTKNEERFTDCSSDKRHSSGFLPSNRGPDPGFHHDDCSPTSKLQRLLAESREMVTNLELSTLLPVSASNPNSTDLSELTAHKMPLPVIEENTS